jgi:hypothetical protein
MSARTIHLCIVLLLVCLVGGSSADLVSHHKLDGNIEDSVGSNHGTAFGNPAYAPGIFGQAMVFDGVNDYVEIPPFKYTNAQGEFGLTFWFKVKTIAQTATNNAFPYLFNQGIGNKNNTLRVMFRSATNQLRTDSRLMDPANPTNVTGATGTQWIYDIPGEGIVDGQWHMYTLTSSAAQGGAIYIDGQVVGTNPDYKGDLVNLVDKIILGSYLGTSRYFGGPDPEDGLLDDLRFYSQALTQEEIQEIMAANSASRPSPRDRAPDAPRDAVLGWMSGESAETHDVYFGTTFADIHAADRGDPLGVLVSRNQAETSYDSDGLLDFGQTYFWRVDEIELNGTIHIGKVWSFTVEPYAYPIAAITATASSSDAEDVGPEKTIDGSGLDDLDQHSTRAEDMWLSGADGPQPAWIEYAFDKVYKLHEMWVWNSNQRLEAALGVGARSVTVQYSVDGGDWTTLGEIEFGRAPGQALYAPNTMVDFAGAAARYVKLTIHSNWGGTLAQHGLSEVRFLAIPVSAREPNPIDGGTDVSLLATLGWRPGRGAASHDVYLSTDRQEVVEGTALAATVSEPRFEAQVDLSRTYYWRVVEVNEAADVSAWEGDVWSFSTQPYLPVDDFESYTDAEGNRVYESWIDGWGVPANGSQVGHAEAPFAERKTVHGGRQSMPLFYDNTAAPQSEAERAFAAAQDWTAHGAGTLSLFFHGGPENTGQMYVRINGAKVVYDGSPEAIKAAQWQQWDIDLASVGADVQAVRTLGIGVDGAGAEGVLYIDDIRLYP